MNCRRFQNEIFFSAVNFCYLRVGFGDIMYTTLLSFDYKGETVVSSNYFNFVFERFARIRLRFGRIIELNLFSFFFNMKN